MDNDFFGMHVFYSFLGNKIITRFFQKNKISQKSSHKSIQVNFNCILMIIHELHLT